jgi:DNA (cytosine-5)-methyltransferase 1
MLKMLDLFSGIGGFSLSGKWAGFETVQFVEKDLFCQKVLAKNFPGVPIHDDIKTFHYSEQVDLLTGGFPCQPFSIAGKKKGINDDRYLWPEMLRIIRECEPNWIVAENVGGIVAMELDNIIDDLENQGYETQSYIIPACASGAPHKRDRLWIVANRVCHGRYDRGDNNTERNLQNNIDRNIQAYQKDWKNILCQPWKAFVPQNWLGFTSDNNSESSEQTNTRTKSITKERNTWLGYSGQDRANQTPTYWQEDQPPIPGVDDGLPNGVDRNKALGNAIVPQIVFPIMKIIAEIEGLRA